MSMRACVAATIVFGWTIVALGAEPFRYQPGKFEQGELRYVGDIPVLTVAGSPEEIGRQIGTLGAKQAPKLTSYPRACLRMLNIEFAAPSLIEMGEKMVTKFPDEYRTELDAIIASSGVKRGDLVLGNTLYDIKKYFGCSTLAVESNRSATGGLLLGRNLDFPTLGVLQDYSLITVYRPTGKRAWASVGFPGMVGCLSGMNDASLCVAVLEVDSTADGSSRLNTDGVTYGVCYRRIMEECTTIDEAYKLLSSLPRTTLTNLAIADPKHAEVLEITPKQVLRRKGEGGVCAATNHFRSPELATSDMRCYRFERLKKANNRATLDSDAVWRFMDSVNQGDITLQTMIFEPALLRLRLSLGETPSSNRPGSYVDLKPYLLPPDAAAVPQAARVEKAAR